MIWGASKVVTNEDQNSFGDVTRPSRQKANIVLPKAWVKYEVARHRRLHANAKAQGRAASSRVPWSAVLDRDIYVLHLA